jgi:hypothetical protein
MAGSPPKKSDDDEPEIEVAPAPQHVPRKRARTPNPAVDDVIATGEISAEPRSRIVKSSPGMPAYEMPKIEVREEPTEPVVPVRPSAPPRAQGRPVLWLVVGGLVLGAGAGALLLARGGKSSTAATTPSPTKPAEDHSSGLQTAAMFIGTTLDADAHAAMVRAEAIASSSMLRAGIETDAKTLSDMAKDNDVTFPIKAGESVEVYQVRQDGSRTSMLRLPSGVETIPAPAVGKTQLAVIKGTLMAIATATIAKRQGDKIGGEIVLAVPIDLEAIRKKVTFPSSLVGLGPPIVIVRGAPGGAKQTLKIETEMQATISLEAVP